MLAKYSLEKKQFNDSLSLEAGSWRAFGNVSENKHRPYVYYPSKEKENSFIAVTNYKPNIKDSIIVINFIEVKKDREYIGYFKKKMRILN